VIKIQGQLDASWLLWFGEAKALIESVVDGDTTMFSNVVMDQAGLVGLIRRLHGHGIVLISVVRCEPAEFAATKNQK
jgi:hypothetical protein